MTQYSFAATVKAMKIQSDCVAKRGIFCSLYSDRAAHFFLTPKAGDKVQEVNKGDRPIFLHIIKYSACPLFPFDLSVSITYGPHLLGYYAPNNIFDVCATRYPLPGFQIPF